MNDVGELPAELRRRIIEVHGPAGVEWLRQLPALVADCRERWRLALQPAMPSSYSYVAPAVDADGRELVLKAAPPGRELQTEIAALRHFDGRGAVRLIDGDAGRGVFLLERALPGTPLADVDDDEEATAIAAAIMLEIWRPPPPVHAFPTVAEWAAGLQRLRARYDGTTGPLPPDLVAIAEERFAELLASMAEPVVLHGDLHHWNILRAQRRPWLAIDPKGVVGEPAYEAGALLRNPMPHIAGWTDLARILARRLDILAERLRLDRQRLLGWGLAQAVLSAWWSLEDHGGDWGPAIAVAEALDGLDKGTPSGR